MIVLDISSDFSNTYVAEPVVSGQQVKSFPEQKEILSNDHLFVSTIAYFRMQLHISILQSWKQYSEDLRDQAERSTQEYRLHQLKKRGDKAAQLEGERRSVTQLLGVRFASRFRHWGGRNWAAPHLHQAV